MADNPDLTHEHAWWSAGHRRVVAFDEAGRGAWAGPLVVGAVVLNPQVELPGVRDSKQLTAARREHLHALVTSTCEWAVGEVTATEIDRLGMSAALTLAAGRAYASLPAPADAVIVDGPFDFAKLALPTECIVRGDAVCLSLAAASLCAKVHRDRLMVTLDGSYPGFGLAGHKGYMTAAHRLAVSRLGLSEIHRHSWSTPKT